MLGEKFWPLEPIKVYKVFSCSHELWSNILREFLSQYKNFLGAKRVIRIITECGNRDSCRILFKKLKFCHLFYNIYFPYLYL
jgi:hypothetical protein